MSKSVCTGVGEPRGVLANMLHFDIVLRDFKLASCYYSHFGANILGKTLSPFISLAMC